MFHSSENYENKNIELTVYKKSRIDQLIPIVCLIMFAFLPTSNNSNIYGINWVVFVWGIVFIVVLTIYFKNTTSHNKTLVVLLAFIIYMLIITLSTINSDLDARISLARIIPLVLLVIMYSVKIEPSSTFSLMTKLLDIFFIVLIVWNSLILIDNSFIKSLTQNYYSQYYDLAIYYSMLRNKPVMSFGVHTYAAYFYSLFFYLSYVTAKFTKKNKYYVYCIAATIFSFFLTSNTSLVYSIIMVFMLIRLFFKKPIFMFILLLLGIIVIVQSYDYLIERYTFMVTQSEISGFTARYIGENTVFSNNIKIIKSNYAIGFTIIENIDLRYSDSGYIVYLTMGNIPLLIAIYYMTFRFLKKNIPREFFAFIAFIIFSFELALPATFNYRYFFAMIFIIYYLQLLKIEQAKINNNEIIAN